MSKNYTNIEKNINIYCVLWYFMIEYKFLNDDSITG